MKKLLSILFILLFISVNLAGCDLSNKMNDEKTSSGIKYEYFYRGFTAVNDDDISTYPTGTLVIQTEDDWHSFMDSYCPGIPYNTTVDFAKESLVVASSNGAKDIYNTSSDITSVKIDGNKVDIQHEINSDGIYALNKENAYHFFLNIIKIDKSDLPSSIENIYEKK